MILKYLEAEARSKVRKARKAHRHVGCANNDTPLYRYNLL